MICMKCGSKALKSTTTDVADLGGCLLIVRNVPCYQCQKCDEIQYTGDVIKKLESITDAARDAFQDISVVDYGKIA